MFFNEYAQFFIALAVLCFTILYVFLNHKYSYWKKRNVPYEKPTLIFGSLSFIMRKSFWDYFRGLRQRFPTDDYVGIFLGWKPALVVQTPELAKRILTTDFEHFTDRASYSSYGSDPLGALNLFTVKNPVWSQIRHEISPMFTTSRLKLITEMMNGNARELVLKIKRDHIDRNEPVNLKEIFSMYTSDIVGSNVFGIKVSALNDPSSPLWHITKHMVKPNFWRGLEFSLMFYVPAVAAFMRLKFFSQGATDYIMKLFWDVVEQRKAPGGGVNDGKDLVNHLLKMKENFKLPAESGTQLADEYMLAQAAVFILGSIETSSTTLSYNLHELAHHPKEQEILYEEISRTLKEKGKDILDYEDLLELKYLTSCILETLRKYPAVQNLDRVCTKQYKLNDHVTIEKGTPVYVNCVALQYDEKSFPNPQEWRPKRMENVQETDNLQFTFLPFGDGPRFCIGRRLGVMQLRAALAQVIAKYKIEPEPTEPYVTKTNPYVVVLAPLSGGRVRFTLR